MVVVFSSGFEARNLQKRETQEHGGHMAARNPARIHKDNDMIYSNT